MRALTSPIYYCRMLAVFYNNVGHRVVAHAGQSN
jgi:hypothetical protein